MAKMEESIRQEQCEILLQFYQNIKAFCDLDMDEGMVFDQIQRTTHQMEHKINDAALAAPSKKFNDMATGLLYDFMGFLTTRREQLVLSSHDDAVPAIQGIKEFFDTKGVTQTDPDWDWPKLCDREESHGGVKSSNVL